MLPKILIKVRDEKADEAFPDCGHNLGTVTCYNEGFEDCWASIKKDFLELVEFYENEANYEWDGDPECPSVMSQDSGKKARELKEKYWPIEKIRFDFKIENLRAFIKEKKDTEGVYLRNEDVMLLLNAYDNLKKLQNE